MDRSAFRRFLACFRSSAKHSERKKTLLEEAKTVIFHFRMDEEFSDATGGSFIFKDPPLMAAESEVRPRTKPKPKVKSQTVSGIALPGLAEVLNKKKITAEDKVC